MDLTGVPMEHDLVARRSMGEHKYEEEDFERFHEVDENVRVASVFTCRSAQLSKWSHVVWWREWSDQIKQSRR